MKNKTFLRELREDIGKTLEEVSKDLNMPYSTVHALETGMGKGFSSVLKHIVAAYYNADFYSAFPEEREKFRVATQRGYSFFQQLNCLFPGLSNLSNEEILAWITVLNEIPIYDVDKSDEKSLRENMKKHIHQYVNVSPFSWKRKK
jgi:transcriptional regulator with XRE-family HTH domain